MSEKLKGECVFQIALRHINEKLKWKKWLLTGALNAGAGLSASVFSGEGSDFVVIGSGFTAEATVSAPLLFSGAVLSVFVSVFAPVPPSFPVSYD